MFVINDSDINTQNNDEYRDLTYGLVFSTRQITTCICGIPPEEGIFD